VLARWGIRLVTSLVGIAAGIVISVVALSGFSANAAAVVVATIVFWIVHFFVLLIALRIFVKGANPSIAMAGLLALASTVVSLILVNLIVSDMTIKGLDTYVFAALIIWFTTAIGDVVGGRMIRARRGR
jgi:hypothetical protein